MKKKIAIFVLFLLAVSMFTAAQEVKEVEYECGFWCKVTNFLFGSGEEKKALVGQAGGIWGGEGQALVGQAASQGTKIKVGQPVGRDDTQALYHAILGPNDEIIGYQVYYASKQNFKNVVYGVDGGIIGYVTHQDLFYSGSPSGGWPQEIKQSTVVMNGGEVVVGIDMDTSTIQRETSSTAPITGQIRLSDQTVTSPTGTTTTSGNAPAVHPPFSDHPNVKIPTEDLDNYFETQEGKITGFKSNAGYDPKTGIWTAIDGKKTIYSDNSLVKVEGDKILKWDDKQKKYVDSGSQDITKIAGKPELVGDQPVIPLSGDQYSVGGVTLDKSTYDTFKGVAPSSGITSKDNTLSWEDKDKKRYSFSQTSDLNTQVTTTSITLAGDKKEVYTTASGTCRTGCKSEDGWSQKGAYLVKGTTKISSKPHNGGIIINEFDTQTGRAKTIERTQDGETHTDVQDGKITRFNVWDAQGNRVASATKFSADGKDIAQVQLYDQKGNIQAICNGDTCDGKASNQNNIWVTPEGACTGAKSECFKDGKDDQPITTKWCTDGVDCNPVQKEAISDKKTEAFWNGVTDALYGRTKAGQIIGAILNVRPGWHAMSRLFFPGWYDSDWYRNAEIAFAKVMVVDRVTHEACKKQSSVPGENAIFIQTRSGTYQFVGSIQAEKTAELVPILCSYENKTCPKDYVCKNDLCYEHEDASEPKKGSFYKITWGVTAPQDESFTPYIDENGVAVKFNLQFTGSNWWLYADERGIGSRNTITLENGARDGGVIAHYSGEDFSEVCILFGAAPKDRFGGTVEKICASIKVTAAGQVDFETSGAASSTTTQSGKVSVNSNW